MCEYPPKNKMHFNFINVFFLCMVLFTWAPQITSESDDNTANDGNGYLTCQCGTSMSVVNKSLDIATFLKFFKEVSDPFLPSNDEVVSLIPALTGTENCKICELGYAICHNGSKFIHWNCLTVTFKFKVLPRARNETDKINLEGIDKQLSTSFPKINANRSAENFSKSINIPITTDKNYLEIADKESSTTFPKSIAKRSAEMFPKIINIPIGGLKNNRRRLRRTTFQTSCTVPTSLETAGISCLAYPSFIKCIERCSFGYTLDGGISRKMQCRYNESKWLPAGFKECRPFVDCTISLIYGGTLDCTTRSLTKGPECKIGCLHYEDKEAVPESIYSCDIDGKWNPTLPFCVIPKSGLVLAKSPTKKIHDDI